MKQVFQSLSTGEIKLEEVPVPSLNKGQVLIKTSMTLISSGTERFLMDFGKSNLIQKALKQPDRVKDVLDKSRTDGFFRTYQAVQNKLDEPLPLGYCNVGTIVEVDSEVKNLKLGQRVVSNGYHAEYVAVSENLCTPIPEELEDSKAVFTILSSIGLQGIRLINPTLGENILVSGLGIIGILSAQLLKFNGCKVFGIDPDKKKCELAEKLGIKSFHLKESSKPESWCFNNTNQLGMDAVLISATTKSSEPIHLAAKVSRTRGRIILVGVTGIDIKRDLFYKKELSFQVSCSYGPGRYDPNYEELGQDYPIGFVRWTENRNFKAVLHALSSGMIKTNDLISKKYKLDDVKKAYELLTVGNSALGIILEYSNQKTKKKSNINSITLEPSQKTSLGSMPSVSFIGAGNYAKSMLLPAFNKAGAEFNMISSQSGIGSLFLGKKYGFRKATTNHQEVLESKETNAVVIVTRHDSHAKYVLDGLKQGKNVFVEKPICLTLNELEEIQEFVENKLINNEQILMVGFNRRFSPLIKLLKSNLDTITSPRAYVYICNAGFIDKSHWTQNLNTGGGRLLGEACHFVDLLSFLEESLINQISITNIPDETKSSDCFTIQIAFKSGSIGTIHYFSNGDKSYPKERLEVFSGQKIFVLDNFRKLKAYGVKDFKTKRLFLQNKGQLNCVKSFLTAVQNRSKPPIPYNQIFEVQKKILEAIKR